MPESKNRPYARTYDIEFKDGSFKSIRGLDISISSADRIYSPGTRDAIDDHNFIAFRTLYGRDNILIAVGAIKSITIYESNSQTA